MITNGSFESSGLTTAEASGWTTATYGGASRLAAFAGDLGASSSAYETFERGWGSANPQTLRLVIKATDALLERMDEWALNQRVLELPGTEALTVDGDTTAYETFSGWAASWLTYDGLLLPAGRTDTFEWSNFSPSMQTAPMGFDSGTAEAFDTWPATVDNLA